ncbi:MAG: tail fiber domain-containing protein [Ignavibacteriales bacterium]|nr:tail fiber domain-containing protein [Ignavibacteriales bacterium]
MTINTRKSIFILFFSLFLFHFSLLNAQEKGDEKITSVEKINSIQATNDDIKFKDDSNNELINIIDEGNFGSIKFSSGVPSVKTNKLYNENGSLFFGGNKLLTNNTLAFLSDLADVQGDNVNYLLLGTGSGLSNTGEFNTSLGINSLHSNTTGSNNTALGYLAMYTNISGDSNVAIGTNALKFGKGSKNTAIGTNALQNANFSNYNTAIGFRAIQSLTESAGSSEYLSNTAVGAYALANYVFGEGGNTAFGTYALFNAKDEHAQNTAIGHWSQKNADGIRNTSLGAFTLLNSITSEDNIAIGFRAMYDGTASHHNVAIGSAALENINGAINNTACGSGTLNANIGGNNNTAFGFGAGSANTNGNNNTLIGSYTSIYNQTGSNNVLVGFEAGMGNVGQSKSGNVFIGYQAGKNESGSNLLYIDNSNSSTPLIWGDFANDFAAINGKLEVASSTGQVPLRVKLNSATKFKVESNGGVAIGLNYGSTPNDGLYVHGNILYNGSLTSTSDERFKTNIETIKNSLDKIKNIRGVTYDWQRSEFPERNFSGEKQIGVIAQEVEKEFPELVLTNDDGYKSVDYAKLTAILIEAIKEQEKKIEKIKKQNEELVKLIFEFRTQNAELVKQNMEYRIRNEKINEEIININAFLNQYSDLREKVNFSKN